jgi:hypothetical protein
MARYTDLMELKNDTQRTNVIRERVSKVIENALIKEFGKNFVRYIKNEIFITPNAAKVPKNTIVADVADVNDNGGCLVGACVEVNVKTKKWNTVSTKKLDKNGENVVVYGITLDDYDEALEEDEKVIN